MTQGTTQEKMDAFAQLTMLRSMIATVAPEDGELAVIDDLMTKLRSRQYTVAVIGEFNRGKSSLINALLGVSVLPADVVPTTATINRVVYSTEPYAKLHMRSGQEEKIPLAMLAGRVTKLNGEAASAAQRVKEAEIGYPTVFCQNNVAILDTPGLNESEEMNALTLESAAQADALIYTIHAQMPFSISEAEAVCRLLESPNIRHILFTVGFIDKIPPEERERVLQLIQKRIIKLTDQLIEQNEALSEADAQRGRQIVREAAVLGVSAKMALDSFVNGSVEQLRASGIEAYKKALMARLTAQQDEWVACEIRPYLEQQVTATFDAAAGRSLGAMDERIRLAQNKLEHASTCLLGFKVGVEAETAKCRQQVKQTLNSGGYTAQRLYEIIEKTQREEAVQARKTLSDSFYRSGQSGVGGWLKRKAKEMNLYREKSDPQIRGIESGFSWAKREIWANWLPEINELAGSMYQEHAEALYEMVQTIEDDLRGAAKQIGGEASDSLQELTEKSPVNNVALLKGQQMEALQAMQPGLITVGAVENTMRRLANELYAKLEQLINAEINARTKARTENVDVKGKAVLQQLQGQLEALRRERGDLQERIDSTRAILLGVQKPAEEEAQTSQTEDGHAEHAKE